MHLRTILVTAIGLLPAWLNTLPAAYAETAPPLSAEQEYAIASIINEIGERPEQFVMRAYLRAPVTRYSLEAKENEHLRLDTERRSLYASGLVVGGDFITETIQWNADLSCGTFVQDTPPNRYVRVWSHPDGPKPNCLHENTTSHQGSVSVTGEYRLWVFAKEANKAPPYFDARWRVYCSHQGSESGMADCEETLISMKGPDGQERVATSIPPESLLEDTSNEELAQSSSIIPVALASLSGALVLFWFWYRRR